jgi:hypothetical protein
MKIDKGTIALIEGLIIIITLVTILVYTYNVYQAQTEMKETCGWEKSETVHCVCTKEAWTKYNMNYTLDNNILQNGTTQLFSP